MGLLTQIRILTQFENLLEVGNRLAIGLAGSFFRIRFAAVDIGLSKFRIDRDRLGEIGNCAILIAFQGVAKAAVAIYSGDFEP